MSINAINNLIDENSWRRGYGIPNEKKIILYAGGYFDVAPNEQDWLMQIDQAISTERIKGKPIILFRMHPVDPIDRWEKVLKDSENIIYTEPWKIRGEIKGKTNISTDDIKNLCSTLKWTDVHINASSTMTVDGAIFNNPQIGPAYDEGDGKIFDSTNKAIYERRHFKPIVESGGLKIAKSKDELIKYINNSLENPQKYEAERKRMVKEICNFDDGKSSIRFISHLRKLL